MIQYVVFSVVVMLMLALDLGVFNKKSHAVSSKEAITWSVVWISLAMCFSGFIYFTSGAESFAKFQSAYWIEKMLSVDNLFVMILIFGYFNVPDKYHHKVLFWGILGALVFRAIFIFGGVGLINLTYLPEMTLFGHLVKINVLLVLFGLFLTYAGVKSAFVEDDDDDEKDFSKSPGAKFVKWLFPRVTEEFEGDKFFVKKKIGADKNLHSSTIKRFATPLLVVLGVIEFTDLLFAVDSIPAIFAIAPNEPFILYSSNIFAILGLRSLYFLLANYITMFRYLKYGLAVILSFIGVKMLIAPFIHISSFVSLGIVLGCLVLSTVLSVIIKEKE
jgi:tellurite resistance protein TerC